MIGLFLAGLAFAQQTPPGTITLTNDSHVNGDTVGFQQGFWNHECWGSTFVPDPSYFPVTVHSVDQLVYGSAPNGFYFLKLMSVDANNKPKDLIAETYIALNSSTTSISRLEMATSDWITGLPPFEFDGENFAVVVCIDDLGEPTGPSTYPQIARDNDGNTHNDRNWIYDVDGNYVRSINYLVMGDWLMRVNVETAAAPSGDADTDTDADSDVDADNDTDSDVDVLALGQITPSTMVVGEAVDVVLLGSGFTADVEVNIGGLSLTGLDVLNSETIDGRVPSAIPAGIHDVEVQIPGGDSVVLEGAFEVTDGSVGETASCGCTSNSAAAGWLALGLAGLIVRRRR